jgi:hypothetical protein
MIRAAPVAFTPAGFPPEAVNARLEVLIDESGEPDMSTLRFVGNVSSNAGAALRSWIAASRFKPATQGGLPVPGLYKTEIRTRMTVRRVR